MKSSLPEASPPKNTVSFAVGQVWKIGDINLAVTEVGKTLVHFKRYKAKRPGNPTTMSSKRDLQEYLIGKKAVLVSE